VGITNTEVPLIFSIMAFLVMFLLITGLWQYYWRYQKRRELKEKIRHGNHNHHLQDSQIPTAKKDDNSINSSVLNFLNFLGKRVAKENSIDYSAMRIKFLNAGIRRYNAPTIFWGTKILLAVLLSASFFMVRITVLKIFDPYATVVICIFLFILGSYLPELWLRIRIMQRKNMIIAGLPDALDLLVICVEAGMGLDAAIQRVSEEIKLSNASLSDEFGLLNLEMRAGKSRQDALRNLAVRTDLEDVNSLVTLLIQTDQFGTSVAQTLRVYSDAFRTKRFQRAEEIAARLPVKLIFPCILFIFPSLFIVILGPAAIRLYQALLNQ
jgi:tight adherence protein C